MKTNEIKKGMVLELKNGWFGIMADNMKGNTRMVDVVGMYREIGSVYSHDIDKVWPNYKLTNGDNIDFKGHNISKSTYIKVEYTRPQITLKLQLDRLY